MAEAGQGTLYDYRTEDWSEVERSLLALMNEKERLTALNIPAIDKMYGRIEAIYATATRIDEGNPFEVIDKELVRFLKPALIDHFINNPEDAEMRNVLSSFFIMMAAATNNFSAGDSFTPYSTDELSAILMGSGGIYDDVLYIRSLRSYLENAEGAEQASLILNALPAIPLEGAEEPMYYWDDALIFALMLQVAWKNFFSFNERGQQFLLQNYFYRAIAAGVPVRTWLRMLINNIDDPTERKKTADEFLKYIDTGNERIPVNTETMETKKLSEIVRECASKSYGDQVEILAQDKFISDLYRNQVYEDEFSGWLREALFIVFKLRKNDMV